MTKLVIALVSFCQRFAWQTTLAALLCTFAFGQFVVHNMAINTDIDQLMEKNLTWRIQEQKLAEAFPQNTDRLVIVIDSDNPDMAEYAAATLASKLKENTEIFKRVTRPEKHDHFQKNGLLLLDTEKIESTLETLITAQPMLGSLAADPSLRGLFNTMDMALRGVEQGQADYTELATPFKLIAQTAQNIIAGKTALLPWQQMLGNNKKPSLRNTRKFIITQPVLNFKALSPGAKASAFIRDTAKECGLTPENGVTVRLTGSVALNDEEFASVAKGAELATAMSLFMVMLLLFFALRSWRLIVPILVTLVVGLIATTAFALATVGSLNLISVAFAVMFVGVAVDFGIQFGVRYREVHHNITHRKDALQETARIVAQPLSLAAAATVLGLMAFIPTDYRGVAELGFIAGIGMIIAFILNITLLPALITLFCPPAEPMAIGYQWLKPVDLFLCKFRKRFLILFALITVIGLLFASQTRFDFDPLNLKDPTSESVATLFHIMEDPDATIYTVQILAPSLENATKLAAKLDELPQVDHTMTLVSFVPTNQDEKLALIEDAQFMLDPSLYPEEVKPAPSDEEIYAAFKTTSNRLKKLGDQKTEAYELAAVLDQIIEKHDSALLAALDQAIITGIKNYISQIRALLNGNPADLNSINDELRRDWITSDGRAKIEVYPKGNARDPKILSAFTEAVHQIAPQATGAPISIQESGKTVMNAFTQAGVFALIAIFILLCLILQKLVDVFYVIAPLILAGILTLGTMAVLSIPLNFANVIALPLLLSLGVSYAIYFVTYWRSGNSFPLASGMARAVLFSAATTLVAFFSLSLSSHIGTRSMGQLLTISLLYCVLCSFLLLSVLLKPKSMG